MGIAKAAGVVLAAAAIGGMVSGVALGAGVTGGNSPLVDRAGLNEAVHLNSDRVKFQTKDPTQVTVQKLTFAANSTSGWHHHPGMVIVAVQSGVVTHTDASCRATTYGPGRPAGAVFVEGGDAPAQASSTSGGVVYVTYITPQGQPLRVDDSAPACDR